MGRIRDVIDQKLIRDRRVIRVVADDPLFRALEFFQRRSPNDFNLLFEIARCDNDRGARGKFSTGGGDDVSTGQFSNEGAGWIDRRSVSTDGPARGEVARRIALCFEANHITRACSRSSTSHGELRRLFLTTNTVVVAVPDPAVAVIVALPGPTPVTTPPAATVATCVLSEVQLTGTPVRGLPPAIRVTASSCTLPPATSGLLIELISTVLTLGAFTMNVVNPGLPPTIAPTVT